MSKTDRPTSAAYILPGVKNFNYNEHDLIKDVCTYFKISVEQVKAKTRLTSIVRPRQICMYFLVKKFPREKNPVHTTVYFGSLFGKDHATVIHSCNTVSNDIDTTILFREMVKEVEILIDSHIATANDVAK